MRFLKWAATGAAFAAAALLAACGGSGGTTHADMRLINASAGYPSLDMTVNNASVSTGVAYGTAGSYTSVDTSTSTTQVIAAGTTVIQTTPSLSGDVKYSLIAYGWPNNMRTALLQEAEPAPAANYAKVLVLNLAPDAGALNVYITQGAPAVGAAAFATGVAGGSGSGYLQIASSSTPYHVRVTGYAAADNASDVRLDFDGLQLDSTSVNTLIITPTAGGVLVNAMSVVQTGAIKPYGGSYARIRAINSVVSTNTSSPNVTLSAARGGTSLLNTSFAASIGSYQIVGANNTDANTVLVNGAPVTVDMSAATTGLTAGSDYTLLVYGYDNAPKARLLVDDNRLPTSGYAKFRVINGAPDVAQSMTMKLNFTPVADNIAYGTSSTPYATVATTGANMTVTAANAPGLTPFSLQNFTMVNQGVYTVYMLGNSAGANNLVSELRQDR